MRPTIGDPRRFIVHWPVRKAAATLIALWLCVGCASEDGDGSSTSIATMGLAGREFVTATYRKAGVVQKLVNDSELGLGFSPDGTRAEAKAGCNTLMADAAVQDGHLVVSDAFMTLIGCPDLRKQEDWYFDFLAAKPAILASSATVTLTAGDIEIALHDEELAHPDKALTEGIWNAFYVPFGDCCVKTVSADPPASIRFGLDGKAKLFTGCKPGTATYTISGDKLRLDELSWGAGGCADKIIEGEQAGFLSVVVQGAWLAWQVDIDWLRISHGDLRLTLKHAL